MAMVAFGSNRSPGLTTAILAIAATWPAPRRAIVAELDPDGGTVAGRQVLPHDPGLISLAAAGNQGLSSDLVLAGVQQLANGTLVLLAPPGPDRVTASLDALGAGALGRTLAGLPGLDVLADCGRLDRRSPALPCVQEADAVVFVVRSSIEDVVGLQHRLQTLELRSSMCAIVAVGRRPYPPEEIAQAFDIPVIGFVEHDPRGAAVLGAGGLPERSPLLRSAEAVSREILRALPGPAAVNAGDSVPFVDSRRAPSALPPTHPSPAASPSTP
ncbi:MAG: GTPase domain-containing protein [Actinomycetota bacterium]|nr:GTPase domain-containing protein [Actinomycetota bacterium]MDQ6944821.1 GTPase domain-containing protein [Actinomycetota bacterium]